jgi:isoleucyl-tRNA synthetase
MIRTTTPWTLAANLAIAASASDYTTISYEKNGRRYAPWSRGALKAVVHAGGLRKGIPVAQTVRGSELDDLVTGIRASRRIRRTRTPTW